jgi:hypothetical protein
MKISDVVFPLIVILVPLAGIVLILSSMISQSLITSQLLLSLGIAFVTMSTVCLYADRKAAEYEITKAISEANGELCLLGGSLTMFFYHETRLLDLKDVIGGGSKIARLKILIPDPNGLGPKLRSWSNIEEKTTLRTSWMQRHCLEEAERLQQEDELGKVHVKKYSMLPHCFLLINDKRIIWQPYDFSSGGSTAPVFVFENGSHLF